MRGTPRTIRGRSVRRRRVIQRGSSRALARNDVVRLQQVSPETRHGDRRFVEVDHHQVDLLLIATALAAGPVEAVSRPSPVLPVIAARSGCCVTPTDAARTPTSLFPGWPCSLVTALETGRSSWTAPLDARRLAPGDNAASVTAGLTRADHPPTGTGVPRHYKTRKMPPGAADAYQRRRDSAVEIITASADAPPGDPGSPISAGQRL
jgi:hypothetical protein